MTAQEMLNKRKFNTNEPISLSESDVKDLMNEFALHIAEQVVLEEKQKYSKEKCGPINTDRGFTAAAIRGVLSYILSRIKQLTEEQK